MALHGFEHLGPRKGRKSGKSRAIFGPKPKSRRKAQRPRKRKASKS